MPYALRLHPAILLFPLLLALRGLSEAQAKTADVVEAANKFLATLSAEHRQKVTYGFDDAQQRAKWSNFPTGVVPRGGISLQQMTPVERDAAMKLLATVLSPMGLQKVNEIREADDDFKVNGSRRRPGGPPPGGPPPNGGPPPGSGRPPFPPNAGPSPAASNGDMFGGSLYYISFLGKPSTISPWMLQFGGHHLALNITISGNRDVMTPSLTGAQPAAFTLNGQTIRPVGRESDKALILVQSLNDSQRKQAVLGYQVPDLVLGPGQDGKTIVPEGIKASAMTPPQEALLLDIVAEWAGMLNKTSADARMTQIKAELNDTWFAWSGPTEGKVGTNITAYYRIQGPHLVIEYAPQHDEPANHVHTIYRDLTNDYGVAMTAR